MSRVAAVDCGTNSIRLLVADIGVPAGGAPVLTDVLRRMEIVRLGAGVDSTGRLAPSALARTFTALRGYAAEARSLGAERVRMVATSATRDASNRADFVAGVRKILGVDPEVVTGDEEAALSYAGATRELPALRSAAAAAFPPPYLVVDIGGGSTEFVLGDDAGPRAARSVDVGCVRLAERHLASDPPTAAQVAAVVADAEKAVDVAAEVVPLTTAATLIGVAGTVTTVAGIALDLPDYDASRLHLARISAAEVEAVTARLAGMTAAERAAIPVMHPGRVDVIVAGALVLRTIVRRTGAAEVVAGEHDILDGIAWSLADVR